MNTPILQTDQLTFGFEKNQPIVNSLNLRVEQGSIYGFLGPNGAGKTTTIRLMLGLLSSAENSIRIFGKTLAGNRQEIFGRIGSLIEMPSLYEHLSGWDNLDITRRLKNIPKARIGQVLEQVRLSAAAQKKVKAYSLGMKQRLGLAMALLSEPELLILDEPTNGLDPNGMIETRELLMQLNRESGTTIFLSSHLLSEIEKMATHVGIINKGNLVFQGTIQELTELKSNQSLLKIETSDNERAYALLQTHHAVQMNGVALKTPFESKQQAAHINKFLIQNEIDVYQLSVAHADLEQMFLQLTE